MGEHDGIATFSLSECQAADRQGYCDGALMMLWAIEARVRRGMPWPMLYGHMKAFIRGPLRTWAEATDGDVNTMPPAPAWRKP